MKRLFLVLLLCLFSQSAWAGSVQERGIVMGTAIKLDARSAPEMIGKRGIVVGTCRQLEGKPLILKGRDGRSYQLTDGVYESRAGIRIHVRKGAIDRISSSASRKR